MTHRLAPAADRTVGADDNNPPTDANPLLDRLNENHSDLLAQAAQLEAKAATLPKAEDVTTDDHVAKIDDWVKQARLLTRRAESERVEAKAPYFQAGKTIDGFFGDMNKGLNARINAVEERKKPYLVAKARREQAEREARERAQREEAERQREIARQAEERAAAARRAAEEEAERLRQAEANRQAALVEAEAGEADAMSEAVADFSAEASESAEDRLRTSEAEIQEAERVAADARAAAAASEKIADRDAKALAGGGHKLAKTGASTLRKVWRWRFIDHEAFNQSLGWLPRYMPITQVQDALDRWARDLERPPIPGVEAYEDYDASTHVRS